MQDLVWHILGYFGEVKLIHLTVDANKHHGFSRQVIDEFLDIMNVSDTHWRYEQKVK